MQCLPAVEKRGRVHMPDGPEEERRRWVLNYFNVVYVSVILKDCVAE